jgi:pyridoxine kinase
MPLALILSSHVASSRVGGFVQALALSQLKIDPIVVPTVLFGRHPGWGVPGGDVVGVDTFQGMLDGIEANGLFGVVDLVITGYFANGAQVRAAGRAIDKIRAAERGAGYGRKPRIVVDPIMGDEGKGLYVNAEVSEALMLELIPRADLLTPNAWEIERITGARIRDARGARGAARQLGRPTLVTSTPHGADMAVVYADNNEAWVAAHPRQAKAPHGVGDLLTALFAAALVEDQPLSYALARSVGAVYETVLAAEAWAASELPVVAMGPRLRQASPAVRIERLI